MWVPSTVIIAPRISGCLSAVSSILILYKILQSYNRLSTVYHRIMFGMSLSNMIGTVAICLTSIPMPEKAPYGLTYHFEARRVGNQLSCELQGFAIMLGLVTSFAYNGTLSIYYVFAIGFRWKDTRIRHLEPLLFHLVPIATGLVMAIVPWIYHNYNPSGLGVSCGMAVIDCEDDDTINDCNKKGNENVFNATITMLIVLVGILFFVMFVCFAIILASVAYSTKEFRDGHVFLIGKRKLKLQRQLQQQQPQNSPHTLSPVDEKIQGTEQYYVCPLVVQIAAYIIPLVLSFIFQGLIILDNGYDGLQSYHGGLTWLSLVFSSLQGVFNMMDFMGHKVYNYRRVNENTGIFKSIYIVLKSSDPDPILITGLSLVEISQCMVHLDVAFLNREMGRRICKSNSLEDDINNDIESDAKQSVGNHVFAFSDSQPSLGGFSCFVCDAEEECKSECDSASKF